MNVFLTLHSLYLICLYGIVQSLCLIRLKICGGIFIYLDNF